MRTVSLVRANVIGGAFFFGTFLAGAALYAAIWSTSITALVETLFTYPMLPVAGWAIFGIVAHELLHGVGFRYFGNVPWRDVRYGVHWKLLTPYATTPVPMPIRAYRGATVLPGIVTGLLPLAIGLATGREGWMLFGGLLLGGAGGDALIIWQTRDLAGDTLVRDSATLIGCEVVEPTV